MQIHLQLVPHVHCKENNQRIGALWPTVSGIFVAHIPCFCRAQRERLGYRFMSAWAGDAKISVLTAGKGW